MKLSSDFNSATILIVDDDPSIIMATSKALLGIGRIVFATSGCRALELAESEMPDIILLDIEMPGMSGFEVCSELKANEVTANIPILFITSHSEAGFEEKVFDHGATDFIHKPVNPRIVAVRTKAHIAHKQAIDRLQSLTFIDSLTGLHNPRALDEKLAIEWLRAKRNKRSLALLKLELDDFKTNIEHFGHTHADDCIKKIASILYDSIRRPADFIAVYGEQAFAILLPDTDLIGANQIGENILKNIASQTFPDAPNATDVECEMTTISIGCYALLPSIENSPELLLSSADKALSVAKKKGRGCIYSAKLSELQTKGHTTVVL
jgi:diguanylate cyclase (GGDEF)-like protein